MTSFAEKFPFLGYAAVGDVLLVEDAVYVAPARLPHAARKAAMLSSVVRAVIERRTERAFCAAPGKPRAGFEFEELPAIRFSLCELRPLLQALDSARGHQVAAEPQLDRTLSELEAEAAILRQRGVGRQPPPPSPEQVGRWFDTPVLIRGRQVLKLEPARTGGAVSVEGKGFHVRPGAARPMSRFLAEVERAVASYVSAHEAELPEEARALDEEVERWILRCAVRSGAGYAVLHSDAEHTLLWSNGEFALARAAYTARCAPVHVVLPIRGATRAQRLAVNPVLVRGRVGDPLDLSQTPARTVCPGRSAQYRHLHSPSFSEAESVVLWLDAGVNLATGRSRSHRRRLAARLHGMSRGGPTRVARHVREPRTRPLQADVLPGSLASLFFNS